MSEPRVFTSRYAAAQQIKPAEWVILATIGFMFLPLLANPMAMMMLMGFGFFVLPRIQQARARSAKRAGQLALRMSEDGLEIDGLGQLPWSAIKEARAVVMPLGPRSFQGLGIELTAPLEVAATVFRPAQMNAMDGKIWNRTHAAGLAVRLHGLEDSPSDIMEAFEFFLGRPLVDDMADADDDLGPRALN